MALSIDSYGRGEDVVLLHGWGMYREVWQSTVQSLAQSYCIHNVDLPGYGGSDSIAPYSLPMLAETIASQFPFPVHVVGWSLGGLVGLQWALARPEAVKSLSLVASSPCFLRRPGWECALSAASLRQFATQLVTDYWVLIRRFLALQAIGSEHARTQIRALQDSLLMRAVPDKQVLLHGLEVLKDSDLRGYVPRITCPVLLHYGENDLMAPVKAGEWLYAVLPDAQLVIYPKAGHLPFLSHEADFLAAQQLFLQRAV